MPLQSILVGAAPNDKTGETLRNAFIKTNANFTYVDDRVTSLTTTVSNNLTTFNNFAATKAVANGLASLDASALLPDAQLRASGVTAGTYPKVTVDVKGRVITGAALAATDIPSLDAAKVTTGTFAVARGGTGLSTLTQGGVLYGSSTTAAAMTAAGTTNQVLKSNGTSAPSWVTLDLTYMPEASVKKSVRAGTTANITLSGTQTIDDVELVANDRVLVKNQATASENGIYVVSATAWTRATDADTAAKLCSCSVSVDAGTTNGGRQYDTDFKITDTVGTTAMSWNKVVDTGMAGTTEPLAHGTAAAGTSESYARADHVHPLQTNITGNAATATTATKLDTTTGSAPAYAARAWGSFNTVPLTGTYTQSGTLITVTMTNHGLSVGQLVTLDFTTGTAVDGVYEVVTVPGTGSFTITGATSLTTSGAVTRSAFIYSSANVLGVTDNGVGLYAVNLATAMNDAWGSVVTGGFYNKTTPSDPRQGPGGYLSNASTIVLVTGSDTVARSDWEIINFAVFE